MSNLLIFIFQNKKLNFCLDWWQRWSWSARIYTAILKIWCEVRWCQYRNRCFGALLELHPGIIFHIRDSPASTAPHLPSLIWSDRSPTRQPGLHKFSRCLFILRLPYCHQKNLLSVSPPRSIIRNQFTKNSTLSSQSSNKSNFK